jgi:hypothetical protein
VREFGAPGKARIGGYGAMRRSFASAMLDLILQMVSCGARYRAISNQTSLWVARRSVPQALANSSTT